MEEDPLHISVTEQSYHQCDVAKFANYKLEQKPCLIISPPPAVDVSQLGGIVDEFVQQNLNRHQHGSAHTEAFKVHHIGDNFYAFENCATTNTFPFNRDVVNEEVTVEAILEELDDRAMQYWDKQQVLGGTRATMEQSIFTLVNAENCGIRDGWNLSKLSSPLSFDSSTIVTSGLFISPITFQPFDLPIISYLLPGSQQKIWVIIPRDKQNSLMMRLANVRNVPSCRSPLLHGSFAAIYETLVSCGAEPLIMIQKPNEYFVVAPGSCYQTLSFGITVAEEINFYSKQCYPIMLERPRCECKDLLDQYANIPGIVLEYGMEIENRLMKAKCGPNARLKPAALHRFFKEMCAVYDPGFVQPSTPAEPQQESHPLEDDISLAQDENDKEPVVANVDTNADGVERDEEEDVENVPPPEKKRRRILSFNELEEELQPSNMIPPPEASQLNQNESEAQTAPSLRDSQSSNNMLNSTLDGAIQIYEETARGAKDYGSSTNHCDSDVGDSPVNPNFPNLDVPVRTPPPTTPEINSKNVDGVEAEVPFGHEYNVKANQSTPRSTPPPAQSLNIDIIHRDPPPPYSSNPERTNLNNPARDGAPQFVFSRNDEETRRPAATNPRQETPQPTFRKPRLGFGTYKKIQQIKSNPSSTAALNHANNNENDSSDDSEKEDAEDESRLPSDVNGEVANLQQEEQQLSTSFDDPQPPPSATVYTDTTLQSTQNKNQSSAAQVDEQVDVNAAAQETEEPRRPLPSASDVDVSSSDEESPRPSKKEKRRKRKRDANEEKAESQRPPEKEKRRKRANEENAAFTGVSSSREDDGYERPIPSDSEDQVAMDIFMTYEILDAPQLTAFEQATCKNLVHGIDSKIKYAIYPKNDRQRQRQREQDKGRKRPTTEPIAKWFEARLTPIRTKITRLKSAIAKFDHTRSLENHESCIERIVQDLSVAEGIRDYLIRSRDLANIVKRIFLQPEQRLALQDAFVAGNSMEQIVRDFFNRENPADRYQFTLGIFASLAEKKRFYIELVKDKDKWNEHFKIPNVQEKENFRIPWEDWMCEDEASIPFIKLPRIRKSKKNVEGDGNGSAAARPDHSSLPPRSNLENDGNDTNAAAASKAPSQASLPQRSMARSPSFHPLIDEPEETVSQLELMKFKVASQHVNDVNTSMNEFEKVFGVDENYLNEPRVGFDQANDSFENDDIFLNLVDPNAIKRNNNNKTDTVIPQSRANVAAPRPAPMFSLSTQIIDDDEPSWQPNPQYDAKVQAALVNVDFSNAKDFISSTLKAFDFDLGNMAKSYNRKSNDPDKEHGARRINTRQIVSLSPNSLVSNHVVAEYLKLIEERSLKYSHLPKVYVGSVQIDSDGTIIKNLRGHGKNAQREKPNLYMASILAYTHFILYAADLDTLTFFVYNPELNCNQEGYEAGIQVISKFLLQTFGCAVEEIPPPLLPHQSGGDIECAIYCCTVAEQIGRQVNIFGMPKFGRNLILCELLCGRLLFTTLTFYSFEECRPEPLDPKIQKSLSNSQHVDGHQDKQFPILQNPKACSSQDSKHSSHKSFTVNAGEEEADVPQEEEVSEAVENDHGVLSERCACVVPGSTETCEYFKYFEEDVQDFIQEAHRILKEEFKNKKFVGPYNLLFNDLKSHPPSDAFVVKYFQLLRDRGNERRQWVKRIPYEWSYDGNVVKDETNLPLFYAFALLKVGAQISNGKNVYHYACVVCDDTANRLFVYDPIGFNEDGEHVQHNVEMKQQFECVKSNLKIFLGGPEFNWENWSFEYPKTISNPVNNSVAESAVCVMQYCEQYARGVHHINVENTPLRWKSMCAELIRGRPFKNNNPPW